MIRNEFYSGTGMEGVQWWKLASGESTGSVNDHIASALKKCGYTGGLIDMVSQFGERLFGVSNINDINDRFRTHQFFNALTFYKDYSRIADGTYSTSEASALLCADFAVGIGTGIFTSTDSNFTIADGYQATTANDEVLKYAISGNRTAAQETIVIKFTPTGDFANDGVERYILSNDTKERRLRKASAGTNPAFYPNADDNGTCVVTIGTTPLNGVSYVWVGVCSHTSPYAECYLNGSASGTDETADDFTNNAWGTYFYIGSSLAGDKQLSGIISKVAIFNRALSASEVTILTNLLK